MMNEKDIELRFGKKNPFAVPEGYFDSLTDSIMAKLPQANVVELKPRKHSYWKEWTAVAAACLIGAFVFLHNNKPAGDNNVTAANDTVYDEQYQQDMMEYAMVDASDVYAYLSGEGVVENM